MREQDKPFVLYRRGPMNFHIVPRGAAGWMQFAIWTALFLGLSLAFSLYAERLKGRPQFWIALGAYLAATLVWTLAGIAWMKARAEVIDVDKILRQHREAERKARTTR
jgi:hypothetical protein